MMYIALVGLFVTGVLFLRAVVRKRYKDKGTQTDKFYTAVEFERIVLDPMEIESWSGQQVEDDWPETLLRPVELKESYCKVKQT